MNRGAYKQPTLQSPLSEINNPKCKREITSSLTSGDEKWTQKIQQMLISLKALSPIEIISMTFKNVFIFSSQRNKMIHCIGKKKREEEIIKAIKTTPHHRVSASRC